MQRFRIILSGIVLGALAACGGGGGGTGSGTTQLPGVGLNSGNVLVATAAVTDSSSVASGSAGGASFLTGIVASTGQGSFRFRDFALQQLSLLVTRVPATPIISGVSINGTVSCSGGGSAAYDATIADNTRTYLSNGDHFRIAFSSCNESGSVLDGVFAFTINRVSSGFDPSAPMAPYDLELSTTLSNFSAVDASGRVFVNGDILIATSDDGLGNTTLGLSGSALGGTDGSDTVVLTRYDFQFTSALNGDYTLDAMATVGSGKLGGSVSFQTTTTFSGNSNAYNGNATAGTLQITSGVDGSSAIVTAQPDGSNVQIDLDETGSGSYTTYMTTWSALAAL